MDVCEDECDRRRGDERDRIWPPTWASERLLLSTGRRVGRRRVMLKSLDHDVAGRSTFRVRQCTGEHPAERAVPRGHRRWCRWRYATARPPGDKYDDRCLRWVSVGYLSTLLNQPRQLPLCGTVVGGVLCVGRRGGDGCAVGKFVRTPLGRERANPVATSDLATAASTFHDLSYTAFQDGDETR